MRIGVLAPLGSPLTEPFVGGLEKHTVELVRGLVRAGHRVTLFAHPEVPALAGIRVVQCTEGYRRTLRRLGAYPLDILHNNTLHPLPTLLAPALPCPVVTTLHTPPYRRLRPGGWGSRWTRRSQLVAISGSVADDWRGVAGRVPVVYNGVELGAYSFGAVPVPRTAIWYGRIIREKAPHLAIRAARLAGYSLQFAGPVQQADYFRTEVQPLLGEGAHYLGHLTQQELFSYLRTAAVGLVTPVWREPFGLVVPELLASGVPIAGFAAGAVPELVDDRVARLVEVGDVTALATAIHQAAALDRQSCRTYALERFSIDRMIADYTACYHRILHHP